MADIFHLGTMRQFCVECSKFNKDPAEIAWIDEAATPDAAYGPHAGHLILVGNRVDVFSTPDPGE